eukprot:jgi/Psemu1/21143/gm1.21143_g
MPTPFDWTQIYGIEFRFASASNPAAATSLNKAYSEIIGKDELSEFFVPREDEEEEGPLEIAPDPQLHILNCIAKAIAINLVEPPPDEITKGHIANLLDKCVIKHVRNGGSSKRMRYKTEFDAAAKHAIRTNTDDEPIVLIEITITHWRFKKNWRPDLFMEAYTGDPPSDDEVAIPDTPAATVATVSPTEMGQITTLLQQLVNNGNSNNNNNAGANHQATLDLPWNPATLPPPVKERYYKRDEFLTRDDMKDFPITYTDSSGNETVIRQNYYLHNLGSGRNDQRLITRSGDCFDLTRASDKSKEAARDKLFLSGFPQLKDDTHLQVRKWYREIMAHAQQHHIYIHPYYLYRREADSLRGFTIGDSLPHDLPARYELAIQEWGNLIYTALRTDKIIPDSCGRMKSTIQSFEGGQGYEALYTVIAQTHPNSKRPSNAGRMVRNPPNQDANESLEEYYFRYKDYLRLRVFLQNQPGTMSSTEEVSNLIAGTTLSHELFEKTEDERDSDDQFKRDKYKAGRLLQTLQTYEQEIKAEQKYKRNTSKPIQSKQLPVSGTRPGPRRNDRFQKRASNSTVRTPSTLTSHSISLIDSLGYPEMDEESDNPFLHQAYCNAITAFDKQPSLFDTSRKCIVCHMS